MNRTQLADLQYIAPIANLGSILMRGILSNKLSSRIGHVSIAMSEIQDRRAVVTVPGGLNLHEYANLYFTARNPMLFKRKSEHEALVVVRVSTDVLDLPGVVLTDGNAASEYTAFYPSPDGLREIDYNLVFARYWTDVDLHQHWHKKRCKCAEILVPGKIEPKYILGAYASCAESCAAARRCRASLSVAIDPDLFFLP